MSTIEVPCTVEIEQTAESFHAHAIPRDVAIRPGDRVLVHGAPAHVAFGARISHPLPRDGDPGRLAAACMDAGDGHAGTHRTV